MSNDIDTFRRYNLELRQDLNLRVDLVLAGSDAGLTQLRDFLFEFDAGRW